MRTSRLAALLNGALLLASLHAHAAVPYRPFNPAEYSTKDFQITQKSISHGTVLVNITQVRRYEDSGQVPHWCRAWLDVSGPSGIIRQVYFDDIFPVGFSYGIAIPKVQPPSQYLALAKNGDYDGRLFLIAMDGTIVELKGGFYFITPDSHYLFSQYASDLSGLTIFDLRAGQVVFSSEDMPDIQQWYVREGQYFYTESEWLPENKGWPTETPGIVHVFEPSSFTFTKTSMSPSELDLARKVRFDFDPRQYEDCSTGTTPKEQ